jgi:K+-sensing histidine kinase KdpD
MPRGPKSRIGYPVALALVAVATLATYPILHYMDFVVGAVGMLLIVLYTSIGFGMGPAVFASFLAAFYLNFFFVEPVFQLNFGRGPDIVALLGFIVTAVVVGRLSQNASQRAAEAERGRTEIERLYGELQLAFEKSSNLEAVKRSEQMKSALLDAVTHDLRTPLTSIKAAATTLYNGIYGTEKIAALSPELRQELIEVVVEETDRLNHFIDELLVLAKIQSGNVDVTEQPGTAEDVMMAAQQRAASQLRNFRVEVQNGQPVTDIRVANPRIAAQVLYGVLENAAKYSPQGSLIEIGVRAEEDYAVFSVDDQGPGVPESERELIFSRFYRRQQVSASGLGMGLAIARGLVEAIGGSITVTEKQGTGTRFEFCVPSIPTLEVQDQESND